MSDPGVKEDGKSTKKEKERKSEDENVPDGRGAMSKSAPRAKYKNMNKTYDMSPKNSQDTTFDKSDTQQNTTYHIYDIQLNSTYDISDIQLNTTNDITDTELNTTLFDRTDSRRGRQSRVMFCSPRINPAVKVQHKQRRVIKSSLKGSNKSFVFEGTEQPGGARRKCSLTACGSESSSKRLRPDLTSAGRAAKPRQTPAASATARLRTKLTALHQKRFAKMESLAECQQRKTKRAKQWLPPVTSTPIASTSKPAKVTKTPAAPATRTRKSPTTRPGYTRFGFKMRTTQANHITTPNKQPEIKTQKTKPNTSKTLLPTANRKTVARKEAARDTVMRERVSKWEQISAENRTYIKGVRINRRFELLMKIRNLE